MKNLKKFVNVLLAVLVLANMFLLGGCGKKGSDGSQENYEDYADTQDYIGTEDLEDSEDLDNQEDSEDADILTKEAFKVNFEGDRSAELNGKIESISPSDTFLLTANTTEGNLFMLEPYIDFYLEDSEVKYYMITDDCHTDDLVYADSHFANGKSQVVYFDMVGGYAEDVSELDSYALPEYSYTFENIHKVDLSDAQNIIFIAGEADLCAYVDTDNRVRIDYKDLSSQEYTTYSDVIFVEGDSEKNDVTVSKSIYNFVLTKDQELLYIKSGNIISGIGSQEAAIDYVNLTNKIGGKVTGIYNLENDGDCCYAVDENHDIYYVAVGLGDDVTVNKILKMDDAVIADIQGFSGQNENMLIRTSDGSYYYNDGISGGITKIEGLDQTCKKAILLMDGNIIALGNDGYLYIIEN